MSGGAHKRTSSIRGVGHYVPARVVTSTELETRLGLEAGWIVRRTGVSARRFAASDEAVSDLAVHAAEAALEDAGIKGADVSLLLLATSTPDHLLPPSAPLVAAKLGSRAAAMDIAGACSGFVYALSLADGFLRANGGTALVIGANVLSRRINLEDRASSILFGDGAGAVVMSALEAPDDFSSKATHPGLLGLSLSSRGEHYDLIKVPAGGSRSPFTSETRVEDCAIKLSDGGAAFAAAIHSMAATAAGALQDAGLAAGDIDWWIPHQANRRIVEAAGHRIGMPLDKTLFTIAEWGNSSAATIPLTLSHHYQDGRIKRGDTLLMSAVGAGFTEGSLVYRF